VAKGLFCYLQAAGSRMGFVDNVSSRQHLSCVPAKVHRENLNFCSSYTHSIHQQGNRRLHFTCAMHSHHPFPPIGDAAYHQRARRGPSHGIGNIHKKLRKDRACGSGDILTDRQTHRQTYSSHYFTTAPAGKVVKSQIWLARVNTW